MYRHIIVLGLLMAAGSIAMSSDLKVAAESKPTTGISYKGFLDSSLSANHPVAPPDSHGSRVSFQASSAPAAGPLTSAVSGTGTLEYVNSTDWRAPFTMCAHNGYLYVAAIYGILVFDVRNLQQTRLVEQYYWPVPANGGRLLKAEGDFLYALTTTEGVQIFDISNPGHLQPRGSVALTGSLQFMEINYDALLIPSYNGLYEVDIADRDHPYLRTTSWTWPLIDYVQGMALNRDYFRLYVSSRYSNFPLATIMVEDPDRPTLMTVYHGPAEGKPLFGGRIERSGNYLLTICDNYLRVMDLTVPYVPQWACSTYVGLDYLWNFSVSGSRLYASNANTLATYDVSEPCSPVLLAQVELPVPGYEQLNHEVGMILSDGERVYNVGYYDYYLDPRTRYYIGASEIAIPTAPSTTILYTGMSGWQMTSSETAPRLAAGNYEPYYSLRVFDLANPAQPQGRTDRDNHFRLMDQAWEGNLLYLCGTNGAIPVGNSTAECWDATVPESLVRRGRYETPYDGGVALNDIAPVNGLAYLAAGDSGLWVVDFRPQGGGRLMSKLKGVLPPQARSIAAKGNRAYVVCWGQEHNGYIYDGAYLQVLDISNPKAPALLGEQEPFGQFNVEISGTMLATTSWLNDRWIIMLYLIDQTGWPQVAGYYDPPDRFGWLELLKVKGNYLYVKNGNYLDIVDVSNPAVPVLWARQPALGELYDVAVRGEHIYMGETVGIRIWKGPSCCEGTTGNLNEQGVADLSDLSSMVSYLTAGGGSPACIGEGDVDQSGMIDLSDLSKFVSYLTGGGYQLPACQ